ncbi:MAG TPA: patatin-like phospholipase family protein, partial [Candidatus Solibacter sp.]|nr:patatin-like phospholipase family protein [Candidatus Solibacter sp.]
LAKYVGTARPERVFHRIRETRNESLGFVTPDLYSRFKFVDKPRLAPGIGLALGGGFARGYAHLGVLKIFEEQKIPISCISGSSIGSIVGAAYASGAPLGAIIGKCREIRFRDFARWRVSRFGLASNDRLEQVLHRSFDSRQLEHLKIPMAVVATDLDTGEPVLFRQGNLAEAIRASCAFPGLFEPVQIGTRYLADGGLVAPVPTRAARELGAEIVVGVSVGLHDGRRGAPRNIFQVVSRAVSAAQKHQLEVWERHADLVLRPAVHSIAWDDFDRIDEAIEAGATVARNALPQIRRLLDLLAEYAQEPGKQGEYLIAESLG